MNGGETGAFVKVEGKGADEIPAVPFVGLAYGFIWIAILGYVLFVSRGLARTSAGRLLPLLTGFGLVVGTLSGFFGIGGGFLIVPGLMAATGMPLINAIGSSLVSVTAFGLTTAASYGLSGLVDWRLAALFVLGGVAGGLIGIALGHRLSSHKRTLTLVFSAVVIAVGIYVVTTALMR